GLAVARDDRAAAEVEEGRFFEYGVAAAHRVLFREVGAGASIHAGPACCRPWAGRRVDTGAGAPGQCPVSRAGPGAVSDRSPVTGRGIAQSGSAPALGAGCRGFESLYPDHRLSPDGYHAPRRP